MLRPLNASLTAAIAFTAAGSDVLAQSEDLKNLIASPSFQDFADKYCLECHNPEKSKGKFDLETLLGRDPSAHLDEWDEILWMVKDREMPPEDEPDEPKLKRPTDSEYDSFASQLDSALEPLFASAIQSPHKAGDFIQQNCINCHNAEEKEGDLILEGITLDDPASDPALFEHILKRLDSRQMPPADRKRPSEETYQQIVSKLAQDLDNYALDNPQPGRTDTFRRLNRTEYQNAIRDLLAVEIDAAALLPKDESSHGFDNITVGNLSPTLLDRYINAAQKIARLAVGTKREDNQSYVYRTPADLTQERHIAGLPLGTQGGALINYTFPQDGEYEIQIRLSRDRNEHVEGLKAKHEMDLLLDRELVHRFEILPPQRGDQHSKLDQHLRIRVPIEAGPRELGVAFLAQTYSLQENKRKPHSVHFNLHRHPRLSPAVYQVSITGPFNPQGAADTPSRAKIFSRQPNGPEDEETVAEESLAKLMRLAYRRPIAKADLKKPMRFYKEAAAEGGFETGIEMAISSILINPEFIFRVERDPKNAPKNGVYPISDLELASRISFFLWSSIPDTPLLEAAESGKLRDPQVLESQIRRMLADLRSESLVTNFASQWLYLRNLDTIVPDQRLFPDFDDNLRQAFRKETELFVQSILSEDQPITNLIKSNYTFLNERLAKHYEIPHIYGSRFRKVDLEPSYMRGGLLRHGSVLTVTSYATRTSPTIRGNWILENILGTPPPPPPPNVPDLESNEVDMTLPMRELLAEHRENPTCASCHNLIDPVGFVLENYDAVGKWREYEHALPIDSSGGLPDGNEFEGVEKLENGILARPELFASALTEKLLIFSLGRGAAHYDAPSIRKIVREAAKDDYRFSSLIVNLIQSVPFQMRSIDDPYLSSH
ncbi:MAG: DUF1592 domain-containing protein [Verrucomicrobiota bacterium]